MTSPGFTCIEQKGNLIEIYDFKEYFTNQVVAPCRAALDDLFHSYLAVPASLKKKTDTSFA